MIFLVFWSGFEHRIPVDLAVNFLRRIDDGLERNGVRAGRWHEYGLA
jgi:hypothetical protein